MIVAADFFSEENLKNLWNTIATWCMGMGKNILICLVILFVGSKLIKWLSKQITKLIAKTQIEPIVSKFLVSLIRCVLYVLLVIIIIGILGIPTTSIIAALSAVGLTIGLALQGSLSNFAGGVLILVFKPFRIGDYIQEDTHGNEGTVSGIDLIYTRIRTLDNKVVIIPNGTLANASLTNYTLLGKRRIDLITGISYDSDIKVAKHVLEGVIAQNEHVLHDEPVDVYVDNLADSQINLGTRCWVNTDDYWPIRWELIEQFKIALDENGIEIPFNQLSVSIKKDK